MMRLRRGRAVWLGDKHQSGHVSTASGTLKAQPISMDSRFGDAAGANPEELIAAAHASCFAMDLAIALTDAGHHPTELRVTADVTLAAEIGSVMIASSHIDLIAIVPEIDYDQFKVLVDESTISCPISRLLRAKVTIDWSVGNAQGVEMQSDMVEAPK